ncbi:MAG TPA: hypothetical protein VG797_09890 [Phycisphaerales bacterium]|nr:hypothetical protein [Phycisphaerales bacterium]
MKTRKLTRLTAVAMGFMLVATAFAWVPKKDIKAERDGATKFKLTGTNTNGKLDVKIEDKHLFQGFKGEGTNGEKKVTLEIKSAGLGAGWKIEGKIGDEVIDLRSQQQGALSKEWKVTGKVGERKIDETIDGDWDVDPAIVSTLVAFDY